MRDLFSQCTCVRAYVRTYVSVTLRNLNLRSRSECQFALTSGQDIGYVHYTTKSGRRFLQTDGEDTFAMYVFAERSA